MSTAGLTKKIKAIFIVHGIGEQESFDTLFDFYDGIYSFLRKVLKWHGKDLRREFQAFEDDEGQRIEVQKRIKENLRIGSDAHLLPRSVGLAKEAYVDIIYRDETLRVYEIWWAKDFTPPRLGVVIKWLFDSALIPFKKSILSWPMGVFTTLLYLFIFSAYIFLLSLYYVSMIDKRLKLFRPLFGWLRKLLKKGMTNFVGDVVMYINDDEQAGKIANYLRGRLQAVLADETVSEVNVVGHSLGSVISYEVLCDLTGSHEPGLEKIKHYFTAGSPLDKIRYFFGANDRFNREIDEAIPWTNYHAIGDAVAGRLDYFKRPLENVMVANRIGIIHCNYWKNLFVMRNIMSKLFTYDVFSEFPAKNKFLWFSLKE